MAIYCIGCRSLYEELKDKEIILSSATDLIQALLDVLDAGDKRCELKDAKAARAFVKRWRPGRIESDGK